MAQQHNRLLIPYSTMWVNMKRADDGGLIIDQRPARDFLPYLVEELIAYNGSQLAIDPNSPYYVAVESLPSRMKRFIVRVDSQLKATRQAEGMLKPILDEFGATSDHIHDIREVGQVEISPKTFSALLSLVTNVRMLFVGMNHQLYIEVVEFDRLLSDLEYLQDQVMHPDSKINLAVLRAIFRSYRPRSLVGTEFRSDLDIDTMDFLRDFIDDAAYRLISSETNKIGRRENIDYSLIKIRREVRDLLDKEPYSFLLDAVVNQISISTGVTTPSISRRIKDWLRRSYLPPFVDMSDSVRRAGYRWRPELREFASRRLSSERVTLIRPDGQSIDQDNVKPILPGH